MKRWGCAILILIAANCLSFCQNKSDSSKFCLNHVGPGEYCNFNRPKVDLHDSAILQKIARLDCYFENRVDSNGFNGAVLVSYKGTPIFERYYGYKNYMSKERLNYRASFQIASTTKTFTSAAILLLYQNGYLGLDDTLQKFFPKFPYKKITVRMLMNHRSGLPNYLNFSELYWKDKKKLMSNQDVLNQLILNKPKALSLPNTRFYYNNTNYVLLALIVEKVSGMNFCDFLHQHIFLPLGMYDTWLYDGRSPRASAVKGYKGRYWTEDRVTYTDGVTGDKGVYSTVRDLYRWDQALYAGKFLKPEVLGLAFTPQSFEKPGHKNYGLGWRMQDQPDGNRLIYHNGWWHSFNSVFNRKIGDTSTVIILSNHYNQSVYKIQPVWDILFGENQVDLGGEE